MLYTCKSIFLGIIILTIINGCSPKNNSFKLHCEGGSILDVKPFINQNPSCGHCQLSIKSLQDGFSIFLTDTTFTILGFRIGHRISDEEVYRKDIKGNAITEENLPSLKKLNIGDFIAIECINIKRNQQIDHAPAILIIVTN